jgi:hypothetical protein
MRKSLFISMMLAAGNLWAADASLEQPGTCSNATLKGDYGYVISGLRPANGAGAFEQAVGSLIRRFDGAGNFTQVDNVHGSVTGWVEDRPGKGTYTVKADCTGVAKLQIPGVPFEPEERLVIVDGGNGIVAATTVPSTVLISSTARKISSTTCSAESLKGTYGIATHGERLGFRTEAGVVFLANPVRVDAVMVQTFDGKGAATETEKVFANGGPVSPSVTTTGFLTGGLGTYQVSPDCTGLETITYPDGSIFEKAFVLSDGGKKIRFLWVRHHFGQIPPQALPPGVTCTAGCEAAEQIYAEGERY